MLKDLNFEQWIDSAEGQAAFRKAQDREFSEALRAAYDAGRAAASARASACEAFKQPGIKRLAAGAQCAEWLINNLLTDSQLDVSYEPEGQSLRYCHFKEN